MSIILHHYAGSPYAEKIRCLLNLKGLAWQSLEVPAIDEGRITSDLTGGYRRIPVMQIGCDFYCDTAEIVRALEQRFPTPDKLATYPGLDEIFMSWGDSGLFSQMVAQMDLDAFGDTLGPGGAEKFIADREKLSGRSIGPPEAREMGSRLMFSQLRTHYHLLEARLEGTSGGFVLGGELPSVADAAIWAHVWFLRTLSAAPSRPWLKALVDELSAVQAWEGRMKQWMAASTSASAPVTAADATTAASAHGIESSRPWWGGGGVDAADQAMGLAEGQAVVVKEMGTVSNPAVWKVEGRLVCTGPHRVTVARAHRDAGVDETVLHLPRAGYALLPAGGGGAAAAKAAL